MDEDGGAGLDLVGLTWTGEVEAGVMDSWAAWLQMASRVVLPVSP